MWEWRIRSSSGKTFRGGMILICQQFSSQINLHSEIFLLILSVFFLTTETWVGTFCFSEPSWQKISNLPPLLAILGIIYYFKTLCKIKKKSRTSYSWVLLYQKSYFQSLVNFPVTQSLYPLFLFINNLYSVITWLTDFP